MRKFAIRRTAAATTEGDGSSPGTPGLAGWLKEHWRLVTLFAIIVAAFLVRFVCAYGISAGSNYALSGGTSAASHLRVITEILAGTYDPSNVSSMNFPYGSASTSGPFFDYLMAGFAYIVSLFGVSSSTAAAGTLAWSAPVLGALTCFPVYLLGKKMFKDELIGLVSALFYAVFALCIMTTPFSNGTEFPLVCFLMAWMFYFMVRMFEDMDALGATGIKAVFAEKKLLLDAAIIGVLYAMIALSWSDFLVLAIMAAAVMTVSLILDRITGRDLGAAVGAVDLALLIGTAIAAVYYIPMGLWNAVFSGGCVLALLTVAFSVVFVFAEKRPWIITVPVFIIAIGAAAVVLYFGLPDIYHAIVFGNGYYDNELVKALNEQFYRTSISSMAAWYGWLTVWFPLFLGAWMAYRYRDHRNSRLYTFVMLWLLSMFFICWFDSSYAVVAGSAFAVAAAAVIVKVLRAVEVRSYLRSLKHLRGQGPKVAAKKVFNFFPFVAVVTVVLLVATPAAVYGCDAMTPTNEEGSSYFGGLGYTINTADSNSVTAAWEKSSEWYDPANGALLSWYGHSDTAATLGKITTVTSSSGGGTFTMANAFLSGGSTGAVSAMAVRLMVSQKDAVTDEELQDAGLSSDDAAKVVNAVKNGGENNETYRTVYGVLQYYSFPTVCAVYEKAAAVTGHRIGYIEADASLLPINYGDSSYFSTIGYLGGYDRDDYGAVTEFFTYPYVSYGSASTSYTNKMYGTFIYQALLGSDPSSAGYSGSYNYLGAVALNDGSVTVTPGYGLQGFRIAYWTVSYNPDKDAAIASDGWETMPFTEAIEKQKTDGGLINYLSSIIIYEYVGSDPDCNSTVSGTVTYGDKEYGDEEPAAGIAVYVYDEQTDIDGTHLSDRAIYSYAITDAEGKYSVFVPAKSETYKVVFATGQSTLLGSGTVTETKTSADVKGGRLDVPISGPSIKGIVTLTSDTQATHVSGYLELTNTLADGDSRYSGLPAYRFDVAEGGFESSCSILPGTYTAKLYLKDGTLLNTVTLTIPAGEKITGLQISATGYTITVTVTDEFGGKAEGGITIEAVNTSTGDVFSAETVGGDSGNNTVAKIKVVAGTYTVRAADTNSKNYVSDYTATVEVTSNDKSVSLSIYEAVVIIIKISGAPAGTVVSVFSQTFHTTATVETVDKEGKAVVKVPALGNATYFAYAVCGNDVYSGTTGTFTDGTGSVELEMVNDASAKISGTVKHDGEAVSATVFVIGEIGNSESKRCFMLKISTDDDGAYSAMVPAGSYTVYAYDGSDNVQYMKTGVTEDAVVDLELTDGRQAMRNVKYGYHASPSSYTYNSKTVPFSDVTAVFTIEGTEYTVYGMTDSSGKATFIVPDNIEVRFPGSTVNGGYFAGSTAKEGKVTAGTGNSYADTAAELTALSFKVPMLLLSDGSELKNFKLYFGDVQKNVEDTATIEPGKYTIEVFPDGSDGGYYRGDVDIYPCTAGYAIKLYYEMLEMVLPMDADVTDGAGAENYVRRTISDSVAFVFSGFPEKTVTEVFSLSDYQRITVSANGNSKTVKLCGNSTYWAYGFVEDSSSKTYTVYYGTTTATDLQDYGTIEANSGPGYKVKYSATLGEGSVTPTVIVFIKEEEDQRYMFMFKKNDDKFTFENIILPEGTYTAFAYDGSNNVSYVSGIEVADGENNVEFKLVQGRTVTQNVIYKDGDGNSQNVKFTDVKAVFKFEGVTYTVPGATGDNGAAKFIVPDGIKVRTFVEERTEGRYVGGYEDRTVDAGAEDVTAADIVFVRADPVIWYLLRGEDEGALTHEFKITREVTEDGETKTMLTYYSLEVGGTANATGPSKVTIKAEDMSESVTVTGKVGITASGTLTATVEKSVEGGSVYYTYTVNIASGKYTVDVPKGKQVSFYAEISTDSDNFTYTSSFTSEDLSFEEESVYNFGVVTGSVGQAAEDVSGVKFEFDDKEGKEKSTVEITFTYTNTGKFTNTYTVAGGKSLTLPPFTPVNIEPGASSEFTVTGTYDATKVAAGDAGMTVDIKILAGKTTTASSDTTVATIAVPVDAYKEGSGEVERLRLGQDDDAGKDAVNDYSYKYALTFVNKELTKSNVGITLKEFSSDEWVPYLVWDSGNRINALGSGEVKALIAGSATDTLYVMLVNRTGGSEPVPNVSLSLTGVKDEDSCLLTPQTPKIEPSEQSADGGGAENSKSSLSIVFWGLSVAVVGLLLLFVWEAMRRGVFARKN